MKKTIFSIIIVSIWLSGFSQKNDKAKYVNYPAGFYQKEILKDVTGKEGEVSKTPNFVMDFTGKNYPTNISKYKTIYHNPPVSQGNSGTCWAYSATSFVESEIYRISNKKIKLSELYLVYWEYVDRAHEFVKTKGKTFIGEGSESNAIKRTMQKHGLMPYSAYNGLSANKKYNSHTKLFIEFEAYLNEVADKNLWNENEVDKKVKSILNKYIGTPPETFDYEGVKYCSKEFMEKFLNINPNNYFSFMSTKAYPYNQRHELEENDNWWHSNEYYNITLTDFISIIRKAISNGYSVSMCGDTSEPGHEKMSEVGIIPTFDIPAKYINEDAREMRLLNGSTTDDHCIQIIGYQVVKGDYWYLIKDSGSGSFDGPNKGYRFYSEDYIKLKMINIMVNVDAAKDILDGIIK